MANGQGCSIETLAELMGNTPQVAFQHYGRNWGQHYRIAGEKGNKRMSANNTFDCIRYLCDGHKKTGTCDRNGTTQTELLSNVTKAIQTKLLEANTLTRLKDAIRKKLEANTPKVDTAKLRKELTDLEAKIEKARRLVEVDVDMLGEVQQHLRGLRDQRDRLEATLKQAGTPRSQQRDTLEEMVDSIFAGVFRLQEALKQGDPATVREMLRCAVERIDLWSEGEMTGKRKVFRLKRA